MNNGIGVLGCGWLGFPLAQQLVKDSYEVHGSTTSIDKLEILEKVGIVPYEIALSEKGIKGNIEDFLSHIHTLIINVPPKLRGAHSESYIDKMEHLHSKVSESEVSKIIFVSSTSVYGGVEGEVTEATVPHPETESGKQLLASEQLFKNDPNLQTTIIRFGGLIGPDRHPVTLLSGRKELSNGEDPVNLIHLNDCIHMIGAILEQGYWDEIFNGVYPLHPTKKVYYTEEAKKRNLPLPKYAEHFQKQQGKVVLSKNFSDKNQKFHTSIQS